MYRVKIRGIGVGSFGNGVTCIVIIIQVINKNKLRGFDHAMRSKEESTPRIVIKLKMKGNRPRGRPILRWLDNIDKHLKEKNASLKEVLETKCLGESKILEDIDFSLN